MSSLWNIIKQKIIYKNNKILGIFIFATNNAVGGWENEKGRLEIVYLSRKEILSKRELNDLLVEGEENGIRKRNLEFIRTLYEMNNTVEFIAKVLNMSENEIQEIIDSFIKS